MKFFSLKSKFVLLLLIITTTLIVSSLFNGQFIRINSLEELFETRKLKSNVKIFDLKQYLSHIKSYDKIKCNQVETSYAKTTLFLHDLKDDIFVSASLAQGEPWEKDLLGLKYTGLGLN